MLQFPIPKHAGELGLKPRLNVIPSQNVRGAYINNWWLAIPIGVMYGHRVHACHACVISGVLVHLFVPHLCTIAFKWFNVGLSVK